jgi:hypothetical protein
VGWRSGREEFGGLGWEGGGCGLCGEVPPRDRAERSHDALGVERRAWSVTGRVARQLQRRLALAAMTTDGGFFNDYYADQVSEPWWGATPPEDEVPRPATACDLAAPSAFSSYMSLDPLKQMSGEIDHRGEWPSSWQDFPDHLVDSSATVPIQAHVQLDREHRWNGLHLSSDNESSPGSPVSAPTFFESEPVDMLEPDFGRVVPHHYPPQEAPIMPVLTQASRKIAASQTVPPASLKAPAKAVQQKEKRSQSAASNRPASKHARPLKKRRTKAPAPAPAPRPQVVQRRSARVPVPRVRQDFAHFTSDEEENEEDKDDSKRSTEDTTYPDGEEETDNSTDENDSSATSLSAAPAREDASAAAVDVDDFPLEVKRCLKASQKRMLEWSEAATILRYHLKLKRKGSQWPKLPPRPLCLGAAKGTAQKGGVYIEMPKVPRPRQRSKSANARAKLTPEQKARSARDILPGEPLEDTHSLRIYQLFVSGTLKRSNVRARCDRSMAQQRWIKRFFRSAQGSQAARCPQEVRSNPSRRCFCCCERRTLLHRESNTVLLLQVRSCASSGGKTKAEFKHRGAKILRVHSPWCATAASLYAQAPFCCTITVSSYGCAPCGLFRRRSGRGGVLPVPRGQSSLREVGQSFPDLVRQLPHKETNRPPSCKSLMYDYRE